MQTAARFGLLVGLLLASEQLFAQTDELTSSSAVATARDRLYAALAADVADLEERGSILKRVLKLATPAVVHIEARREVEAGRSPRVDSEEAGSGVIIERHGKLCVLTNRHVIKYSTLTGINVKLADGRVVHPTQ